jgi:hypothetical protein
MFLSLIKIALNLRLYKYDFKTIYNKVELRVKQFMFL